MSDSLVKYDNPMLLSEARKRGLIMQKNGKNLPPVNEKGAPTTESVLHSILPPLEWEESGHQWVRFVSSTPATRLDVINLRETLDARLLQRGAKEFGVCSVRENLFDTAFDEIIRQVTVSCAQRGMMLVRIRDESRMTLEAYRTLYESAVAYGMRKALAGEHTRQETELRIAALRREKEDLERQAAELQAKCDSIERREAQRHEVTERKHEEEVAFLRKANAQLTAQLQATLGAGKK